MLLTVARLMFAVSVIAGGVSLARLSAVFDDVGGVGEVRFFGIVATAAITLLTTLAVRAMNSPGSSAKLWLSAVLVLHGFVISSWLWSDRTPFSLVQLYELTLLCVILWIGVVLFRNDPAGGVRLFLASFLVVAIALPLASVAVTGGLQGEIAAIGAGGIGTARVLGMGVVAATFFALRSGRQLWLIPIPVVVGGMLLTGSRAAVLALVASLLYLWWQRREIAAVDKIRRTWIQRTFMSAIALAIAGAVILSPLGDSFVAGFLQSLVIGDRSTAASGGQIYLADRDVIFSDAWFTFVAHPFGGLGVGSYIGPFGELYPHNLLLGFAVDAGAIALCLSSALLAYAFLRCSAAGNSFAHGAIAAAGFFMVASLFAGTYYDARFVWLFLTLALMLTEGDRTFRDVRIRGGTPGILRISIANTAVDSPDSGPATPARLQ